MAERLRGWPGRRDALAREDCPSESQSVPLVQGAMRVQRGD